MVVTSKLPGGATFLNSSFSGKVSAAMLAANFPPDLLENPAPTGFGYRSVLLPTVLIKLALQAWEK